jgi:hypothetical protein
MATKARNVSPARGGGAKGRGGDAKSTAIARRSGPAKTNLAEEGRTGNIRQNTRNKGYQQDR